MENDEVLVKVEGLSKKFCKDLKTSLWYGVKDLISGVKSSKNERALRPKEFWAVKDINFELKRGECLGLIGHNGAGKSTLLKILNGLINPDAGQVTIKGRVGALIELGAGFNPILSGRENIYNNGAILGFTRKEIDDKLEDIIDFAEIREFIDMPVQNYSSGMKVRLGFAVAAQMEPDVLIIDEVLAVGDLGFTLKCFKTIDTILPNTAVVFVSHSMPMVSRICNKIILMENGEPKYVGEDIGEGIDKYYSRFTNNNSNVVFDDNSLTLDSFKIKTESVINGFPVINWGGNLKLDINFTTKIKKETFCIVIIISDKEQRPIAMLQESQFNSIENESMRVLVDVSDLQLSKGLYNFNLVMKSGMTNEPRLRINNIGEFQVIHEKEVWQPFLLRATYDFIS
ncbi:ABC transporter ATP-binding protein [Neotamlana laminarinivorans]|uniref:ABC transporter ATP-binding protein n=1 Tax=Neotamlana laminarinivorans TaxID=2883124 RepID=A0A9X1I1U4_9FLAO|nr:ABC transporter ATP-binding protein [Tamlana laminarinivorans]MCB4799686.1 ABC transporter ATP-binding protein [Tamlana laminarinivorans]